MPDSKQGGFSAQLDDDDGYPIVRVTGEIDIATAKIFSECVAEALDRSARLVIDLSEAGFMDSTGISILLGAYNSSGRLKEGIVLRSPPAAVLRTLEISGLDELLTIEI